MRLLVACLLVLLSTRAYADGLLDQGIAHYEQARFEAALRTLTRARAATRDKKALGQVLLYLGLTHAALDRPAEARKAFAEGLRHDPALTLDPERFKPDLVKLFDSVKASQPAPVPPPRLPHRTEPPAPLAPPGPSVVRRGTRAWFVDFAFGPAIGITGGTSGGTVQLKLHQAVGYHFFGRTDGPALALRLSQAFLEYAFVFQAGARFQWDIPPSSRHGIYLTPFLEGGLAFVSISTVTYFGSSSSDSVGGHVAGGLDFKLLLADRAFLLLRPLSIDVIMTSGGPYVRYDLAFGFGVTFF